MNNEKRQLIIDLNCRLYHVGQECIEEAADYLIARGYGIKREANEIEEKKCLSLLEIQMLVDRNAEPFYTEGPLGETHTIKFESFCNALYDALPSKGMVEKECQHEWIPWIANESMSICKKCGIYAPKERPVDANKTIEEGSSAEKWVNWCETEKRERIPNSIGQCDYCGGVVRLKNIAKLSAQPIVPSVDELINTIKPFLFGYSQGENPTSKIAQAIHRMLSKEMK